MSSFWDQLKYLRVISGSASEFSNRWRSVVGFVVLRWVFSSDQCCFDMRSERNGMLRESEVGIVAVESEEQTDLRICLFLGKIPCKKFP